MLASNRYSQDSHSSPDWPTSQSFSSSLLHHLPERWSVLLFVHLLQLFYLEAVLSAEGYSYWADKLEVAGIKGLYRGLGSNLASSAPTSAIYTFTYEAVKSGLLPFIPQVDSWTLYRYNFTFHCSRYSEVTNSSFSERIVDGRVKCVEYVIDVWFGLVWFGLLRAWQL